MVHNIINYVPKELIRIIKWIIIGLGIGSASGLILFFITVKTMKDEEDE